MDFNPFNDYGPLEANIFSSPHKYVQRKGLSKDIGHFVKALNGKSAGIIGEKFLLDKYGSTIIESLQSQAGVKARVMDFKGECSWEEINRLLDDIKQDPIDFIVAFGGGKTIDTGKATSFKAGIPVVVAPTLASNDAPTSALSVIYTSTGEFSEYFFFPNNPYIVLVDTEIIAAAPKRFLVSGMGDAMATYYEADACYRAPHGRNMVGGRPTLCGVAIGTLCRDILNKYGIQAAEDNAKGELTEAVEKVVEANTLLSGLGFESGGLAAAHAIHNGLTVSPDTHHAIHGEKVAYSTMTQLILEGKHDEARRVTEFNKIVGLPYTLGDLHLKAEDREMLKAIAERALEPGESIHNMPEKVTVDSLVDALIEADKLGRSVRDSK